MKALGVSLLLLTSMILLSCGGQEMLAVREIHSTWTPQYSSIVQYFSMSGASFNEGASFAAQVGESGSVKNSNADGMTATAGTVGFAVLFDGTDDRIVIPFMFSLNNFFSISAWIKPQSMGGTRCVITSKDESPARGFSLCVNGSGFVEAISGQGGSAGNWITATGTTAAISGVWTHLAMTFDGTRLRLYKDGILEASPLSGCSANLAKPAYIGAAGTESAPLANSFFAGAIDEVTVWNSVLTQTEIEIIRQKQRR